MTTVVIPYKYSEKSEIQLRYALRSLEKHLKGYGQVFLLGRAPTWLRNVVEIQTPDIDWNYMHLHQKELAIYNKIKVACGSPNVTDDFLLMNDDHYLLQDFNAATFPLYWSGDMEEEADRPDIYANTCRNTVKALRAAKAPILNYDCHCPILYNKERFKVVESLDWGVKYGYGIKSMYANLNGLRGIMCSDLKFRSPVSYHIASHAISTQPFFSTDDKAIDTSMVNLLSSLYPTKSRFEK